MTAQVKTLPHPGLKEAVNGVLHVGKLEGKAHGVVPPYDNARERDSVVFTVQTSTGNTWSDQIILNNLTVGKPVIFSIPKETFEKNLVPDATAKLRYRVTTASGNQADSADLGVQLKR